MFFFAAAYLCDYSVCALCILFDNGHSGHRCDRCSTSLDLINGKDRSIR